jgi:hypothetical protein
MTSDNISTGDPLGLDPPITADTIDVLIRERDALLSRVDQVRSAADQEIALLKDQARQFDWLVRVAQQRRAPAGQGGPEPRRCGCGRLAIWRPGFGYYHDVDGQQVPAGDACKASPLPVVAQPARLPETPAA